MRVCRRDLSAYSRSHRAVIRVYDTAGNVIETHEQTGDFKEWQATLCRITSKQLFRPARFRSIGRALDFSIELCRAYCSCPTSDTLRLRI